VMNKPSSDLTSGAGRLRGPASMLDAGGQITNHMGGPHSCPAQRRGTGSSRRTFGQTSLARRSGQARHLLHAAAAGMIDIDNPGASAPLFRAKPRR